MGERNEFDKVSPSLLRQRQRYLWYLWYLSQSEGALRSISYGVWKLNKCMSPSQLRILLHTAVSSAEYKTVGAREMRGGYSCQNISKQKILQNIL
jgi:hypothetical protein